MIMELRAIIIGLALKGWRREFTKNNLTITTNIISNEAFNLQDVSPQYFNDECLLCNLQCVFLDVYYDCRSLRFIALFMFL